jgi:hypothetical protein
VGVSRASGSLRSNPPLRGLKAIEWPAGLSFSLTRYVPNIIAASAEEEQGNGN